MIFLDDILDILEYVGLRIDTGAFQLQILDAKHKKLLALIQNTAAPSVSVRHLACVIGSVNSVQMAMIPTPLHRALQQQLLETTSRGLCNDYGSMGPLRSGSVRRLHKPSTYNRLQLETRPLGNRGEHNDEGLEIIKGYAFPPFCLVEPCLKVEQSSATLVLVGAPLWPTRPWYPQLLALSKMPPYLLPLRRDLLTDPCGNGHPLVIQGTLRLAAWIVSGKMSSNQIS